MNRLRHGERCRLECKRHGVVTASGEGRDQKEPGQINSTRRHPNGRRKGRKADSATAEDTYEALEKYSQDLTKAAEEGKIDIKPVTTTNFADPWGYRPAFRTAELRDKFNAGLKTLIDSGRYQEIVDSYVN